MEYLTGEQVKDWAQTQNDNDAFCPHCMTVMGEHEGDNGRVYMCRNGMCLDETEYPIEEQED